MNNDSRPAEIIAAEVNTGKPFCAGCKDRDAEIVALKARVEEREIDRDCWKLAAQPGEPAPCGHQAQYSWSPDGKGKKIVCLRCRSERNAVKLSELTGVLGRIRGSSLLAAATHLADEALAHLELTGEKGWFEVQVKELTKDYSEAREANRTLQREKEEMQHERDLAHDRAEKAEARVAELEAMKVPAQVELAVASFKGRAESAETECAAMMGALEKHKHTLEYLLKGEGKCECDPSVGMAPCFSCALDDAAKDILKALSSVSDSATKLLAAANAAKLETVKEEYSNKYPSEDAQMELSDARKARRKAVSALKA